jgi:hypothetical protein
MIQIATLTAASLLSAALMASVLVTMQRLQTVKAKAKSARRGNR